MGLYNIQAQQHSQDLLRQSSSVSSMDALEIEDKIKNRDESFIDISNAFRNTVKESVDFSKERYEKYHELLMNSVQLDKLQFQEYKFLVEK